MGPVFSVIMPVYNGGPYLREAVSSVLAQTYPDFELIIVDDGSTDGACASLNVDDERIRIIEQPNQGPAIASNTALRHAQGNFVAFLDQDDVWLTPKLERHLAGFDAAPDVDLNFTWFGYIGERGQDIGFRPRRWNGRVGFEELLRDNVIGATSPVAIRRSALDRAGEFDATLPLSYDLDLFLRVLQQRPASAEAIPEVLTMYRRHPDQLSRDWRALRADWEALQAKYGRLTPEAVRRVERSANTIMGHYFASVAYERREFGDGLRLILETLQRDPAGFATSFRHWRLLLSCLAATTLPASVHRRLEAMAGLKPYAAHSRRSETESRPG